MTIKSCARVKLGFIVLKYVNLILWKETFKIELAYTFGMGEKQNYFLGIWGARANTFREPRKLFKGFGEINALFSGIKGAQTPPPRLGASPLHTPMTPGVGSKGIFFFRS